MSSGHSFAFLTLIVFAINPVFAGDSWPEWRGATGQGVSDATDLPVKWGEEQNVAWKFTKQVPAVSSPLLDGNELYMVSDKGIVTCLDAQSGELIWKERIGKNYWASPMMADGRIHFFGRDSTATVVKPGRSFRKLAVNNLSGEQLATAAAVDHSLLIRTAEALYCLRSL